MHQRDAAFERVEEVQILAEVRDFEGMPLDAWLSDAGHGFKYLAHLKQFGRIAIVSDQSWLRTVSRIESALLSFIKYEVDTLNEREHALAWVKGETSAPHPEALRILSNGDAGIFEFEIDGRITPESIAATRHQPRGFDEERAIASSRRQQERLLAESGENQCEDKLGAELCDRLAGSVVHSATPLPLVGHQSPPPQISMKNIFKSREAALEIKRGTVLFA